MTNWNITATEIRQIIKASGLAHAEMCLYNAEAQIGDKKLAKARAEFNRIAKEMSTD